MPVLEIKARAKLNLTLDVLGRRPDGFHDLRMVMQSVELCDTIRLETGTGRPLRMTSNLGFLPCNEKNLAAAAALRLMEAVGADCGGLAIDLKKRVPVCAGMAGGSADAAAVLRGLNALRGGGIRCALLRPGGHRPGRGPGGAPDRSALSSGVSCGAVQARFFHLHAGAVRPH